MQLLYSFLPIIFFFAIYKFYGIYFATISAILICAAQLICHWIRFKKIDKFQLISLIIILLLGGLTLILHNPIFIKLKPTVLYALLAISFTVSQFIKKPLIRYLLGAKISLPDYAWRTLNTFWTGFCLLIALTNTYIAYNCSTDFWVNFKLFGILGSTILFVILQAFYLSKHIKSN